MRDTNVVVNFSNDIYHEENIDTKKGCRFFDIGLHLVSVDTNIQGVSLYQK